MREGRRQAGWLLLQTGPTRDLRDGVFCSCSPVPGPGDGDRSQLQGGVCACVFLGGAGCTAEAPKPGPPGGLSWAWKVPKIPGCFPQLSSFICQGLKYLRLSNSETCDALTRVLLLAWSPVFSPANLCALGPGWGMGGLWAGPAWLCSRSLGTCEGGRGALPTPRGSAGQPFSFETSSVLAAVRGPGC